MDKNHVTAFEEYLERIQETYKAQGLIVGLFNQDRILYEKTIGYRDTDRHLPIDKDTIFGIASITKSFTVIGLLQLVEKGLIDIDAPISHYFKDWTLPPENTPTVKHLMSHAGGFFPQERFLMNDFAAKLGISPDNSDLSRSESLAQAGADAIVKRLNEAKQFTGAPGEYMSYSNFSFGLLTDLIRRFSPHGSYPQAIESEVIHPLGLSNTFFDFNRTNHEHNITTLYETDGDGIRSTNDYTDLGFVLIGGGGLKSSFNDLMAYTRFYLNRGIAQSHEILPAKWISEMETSRVSYRKGQGYGYGLMQEALDDFHLIGHSGGLTGVSSFFGYSQETNLGVVVLCNTGGVPSRSIGLAAMRMAHGLYPDHKITNSLRSTWTSDLLNKTAGTFESDEGDRIIISNNDGIMQFQMGSESLPFEIIDKETLLLKVKMEESICRILRDPEGKAWGIYRGVRILPRVD